MSDLPQKSQLLTNSVVKEFFTTAANGKEAGQHVGRLSMAKRECPSQATVKEFLIVRCKGNREIVSVHLKRHP